MEETTLKEELVEFEFTDETLTAYIPTVMVDTPKEALNIAADKAGIGVSLIDD